MDGAGSASGVARWRQIEMSLLREIEKGGLRHGDRLPAEHALAANFGVNRNTVRRALAELQRRGVLRIENGRGAFVHSVPIDYSISRTMRFSQNLLNQNRQPASRLVRGVVVTASADVAERLRLPPGSDVAMLETLGEADGIPVALTRFHIPADRFPGAIELYGELNSTSRLYERFGIPEYYRESTRITVRMPTPDEARHLQIQLTEPILETDSISVDQEGVPFEHCVGRYAGQRVQFVVGRDEVL